MKLKFKVQAISPAAHAHDETQDSRASSLSFVNISHPTQINQQATRHQIRRHVMKDIGRSRRRTLAVSRPKSRYGVVEATSSPLARAIPLYWGDVKVCPNFQRLFRSMDMVSEGLLALALADSAHGFRQTLDEGLGDRWRREQAPSWGPSLDEMRQYTDSLSLVRRSITIGQDGTHRYAVIGTIICLAVFDMRVGDRDRWTMHMEGLRRLIQLGGDVELLGACPAVRQSLFIADVLGSLVNGTSPRFRAPRRHPPSDARPKSEHWVLSRLRRCSTLSPCERASLVLVGRALGSASQLADMLNLASTAEPMTLDLLIPVCRIAHDVLSLSGLYASGPSAGRQEPAPEATALSELVRISVLSMLSTVITTTSGDGMYCATRRRAAVLPMMRLVGNDVWTMCGELKLWMLVIQTLMETGTDRLCLLDQIAQAMASLSLRTWADLEACLQSVVWIEKAAMQEMAELKYDIEDRLTSRIRQGAT
ncbi:hypothetical protein VTK73DRAFT_988 [Phialemonium thermophilum]|uniref:Uncharacterized protein n=1 Tax=Phialemonium thermophilum TaxID=223376 RepID=A0ABR3XBY8_9PEZI